MNPFVTKFIEIVSQILPDSISVVNPAPELVELKAALTKTTNNLWLLLAAGMVFLMNLGFACIGSGLIRSKNTTNILFKTIITPVIVLSTFLLWGYNLMYPGNEFQGGFVGFHYYMLSSDNSPSLPFENVSFWAFFLFQAMLATIAATIVAGAVAERLKFTSYIIFCFFFTGLIYPIIGMWHWGGGWLAEFTPKFYDFAGASSVHMTGGFAALVGAAMLGPRIGKYTEGKIMPIMGHNIPLAVIGLFILWFGWIGFNGGAVTGSTPEKLSYVILITFIAAASGCLGALLISYFINRTHDITMSINGVLSGLVAISASADIMNPTESFIIGLIAGLFVVFSVLLFDKLKIDDPVGAISVHMMCGIWGILSVGIFGPFANKEQFISQLIGLVSIGITVSVLSFIIFFLLKKTVGLRVSAKDELEGLDLTQHGMSAYNQDPENS